MSTIDYTAIMEATHEFAVISILQRIKELGAGHTGSNKVHILFNTTHPGVYVGEYLKNQYPKQIALVFEHQFYNLQIDTFAKCITVQMSFNGHVVDLILPFKSILSLQDRGELPVLIEVRDFVDMTPAPEELRENNVVHIAFGKKTS